MQRSGLLVPALALLIAIGCGSKSGDDDADDDVKAGNTASAGTGGIAAASGGAGGKGGSGGAVGMSSGGTGAASGGAGGSSGSGGMSAATGGTGGAGNGSASDAWPAMPGADCADIGKSCDSGCSDEHLCLIGVDLCLPDGATPLLCSPGMCPDEAPYCVAQLCLTKHDAECACATPDAKMKVDVCKGAPSDALGDPNACLGDQALCSNTPDNCCDGLGCLMNGATIPQCVSVCVTDDDCETGCCAQTSNLKRCQMMEACQKP